MRIIRFLPDGSAENYDSLEPIIEELTGRKEEFASLKTQQLVGIFDQFASEILTDSGTKAIEGIAFLSSWLKRSNLEKILHLNLGDKVEALDDFISVGRNKIAALPRGLVSMWMAGNVPTLPLFSLIPALLTKNTSLVKLAFPEPEGIDDLLRVLGRCSVDGLIGEDLLKGVAVIWFDYQDLELNRSMSSKADAMVVWGGSEAVEAIRKLPKQEHCVELVFGPKYSIGIIDSKVLEKEKDPVEVIAAFARDIAVFDQRACSSPQTIFVEKNRKRSLHDVGDLFANALAKLPPKGRLDSFTTMQIVNARARWAMDESRDAIVSGQEANWSVLMDREVSLKDAVQSRTVFLTEIESWKQIIPLLSPKIQTVGIAFADQEGAEEFARQAVIRGVVRCVRPGLMNLHESPWDGHLMLNELVRWATLKA